MKRHTAAFTLSIVVLLLAAAFTVVGQAGTSTVRGVVTDPQGNVVPGASVKLAPKSRLLPRAVPPASTPVTEPLAPCAAALYVPV